MENKQYTPDEFWEVIKERYPQYSEIENSKLTASFIEKFPQYKDSVAEDSFFTPWTKAYKVDRFFAERWEDIHNIGAWGVAKIPEVASNVIWFWADVIWKIPWVQEWAWDFIRGQWKKASDRMAEFLWVDLESKSAKLWWFWAELIWVSKLKLPAKVLGYVKSWKITEWTAKLMSKYWTSFAKKYPTIAKTLWTSLNWAKELGKFWIVEEGTVEWATDMAKLWAWLWAWGWTIWAWFTKLAPSMATRLQLSGLLNSNKLKEVWKKLKQSWETIPNQIKTSDRAANWMLDRGIKWSEDQMITKLDAHFDKAQTLYKTVINWIGWKYSPPVVLDLLKEIIKTTKGKSWLKKVNKELQGYLDNFEDWLSLSQIDKVKWLADDFLQIFKDTWEAKKEVIKISHWNLRRETKEFIEMITKKAWWDARMLNNEKAVSKALKKWIEMKDETASLKALMWYMWVAWLAGWISAWLSGKDPSSSLWFAIWSWVVWWILSSKRIQTNLASLIKNLSKTEKEKLTKFDWFKYLPEELKHLTK